MPSRPGGPGPVSSAFILFGLFLLSSIPLLPAQSGAQAEEHPEARGESAPPWPMFRGGPARTGLSAADTGLNTGEELRKLKLGGVIYSSPAIAADGTVYIGSSDHCLYAVRPNGSVAWKLLTGQDIDCSPAIGPDGTVYFGSDSLYAVKADGTRKWSRPLLYGTSSSPVLAPDGNIYLGSLEGTLYALDQDGRLLGSFNASGQIASSPALDADGNIYFGSYDGCVYSISPQMVLRWKYQTGDYVGATPFVDTNRTVVIGSKDSYVYALNEAGELKWRLYLGSQVFSSVAQGPDGTMYVGCGNGRICAINPGGTLQWDFKTGGWVDSSPAVGSDGTVFVGSEDGYLYALFPNGTLKWKFRTEGEVFGSPAIASNGSVVFGSWDKHLYCVGARYTRPGPPSGLEARLNGSAVELRWRPPAFDGGKPLDAYRVFRALGPGNLSMVGAVCGKETAFTDQNLTGPGIYHYHVTALNPVGESPPSEPVNVSARFRPQPPRNLRATAGNASVRLDWEPPASDGGAEVSAFRLYRSGSVPAGTLLVEVPASVRKFDQVNLENFVSYVFEVTAVNVMGESDPSANVSATPRPPQSGLPSPPRNVAARSWDRAVDVSWAEPETDGGHPVTLYRLFRETAPGVPVLVTELDSRSRAFRDLNVTNGDTYWYHLKAVNVVGESEYSQGAMARPLAGLADDRPPEIEIVTPGPGATVHSRRIPVRGHAQDDSGIALVELSLDGREWFPAKGTADWSGELSLAIGKNTIHARAKDSWDNNATAVAEVGYEPPASTRADSSYPLAIAILLLVVVLEAAFVLARRWRRPQGGSGGGA